MTGSRGRQARLPLVIMAALVALGLVAAVLVLVLAGGDDDGDSGPEAERPNLGPSGAEVAVRKVRPRPVSGGKRPPSVEPPYTLSSPGEYCDGNAATEPPPAFDEDDPRVAISLLGQASETWQWQFGGVEEPWGKDVVTNPEEVNLVACVQVAAVHEGRTKRCERSTQGGTITFDLVAADYTVQFVTPDSVVVGEGEVSVGKDCPLLVDAEDGEQVVATPGEPANTKLVNAFLALQ